MNDSLQPMARPRIMVVDDVPASIDLLRFALEPEYEVIAASSAIEAERWLDYHGTPDVFLLDVVMPEVNGYTLCERLKQDPLTRDVPVIFLTGQGDPIDELQGFDVGAVDYIVKPAPALIVRARVRTQLALRRASTQLAAANRSLAGEVRVLEAGMRGIVRMSAALGKQGAGQLTRIQHYMELMLTHMASMPDWRDQLTPSVVSKMTQASVLYDIGKMAMPTELLTKPGPLNADEWRRMQTHAEWGGQALQTLMGEVEAEAGFGHDTHTWLFLELARDMALSHHEHWDGAGYPLGLQGHDIPLCAQIVGLLDTYDALLSKRPHKSAWPSEAVLQWIRQQAGSRFNPRIVSAFCEVEPDLYVVWQRHTDPAERF